MLATQVPTLIRRVASPINGAVASDHCWLQRRRSGQTPAPLLSKATGMPFSHVFLPNLLLKARGYYMATLIGRLPNSAS
jgi:hypothetical protein